MTTTASIRVPSHRRATPWRWPTLTAVLATAALAAGCGDDGAGTSNAEATDGPELYATNCASCHGPDLRGTALGPSHLSIVYQPGHHPDESFRAAITSGVTPHHWNFGPMQPVAGLDDDEMTAIIAYVRDVQQREGFEPYPPD